MLSKAVEVSAEEEEEGRPACCLLPHNCPTGERLMILRLVSLINSEMTEMGYPMKTFLSCPMSFSSAFYQKEFQCEPHRLQEKRGKNNEEMFHLLMSDFQQKVQDFGLVIGRVICCLDQRALGGAVKMMVQRSQRQTRSDHYHLFRL